MSDANEALYFRDLNRFPTLSPQEEEALLAIIKSDQAEEIRKSALQRLIRGNLRFVVSVARKYQGRGLSLLDLINEGNIGLFKAAKRFDMGKDVKFISYAVWWIRQSIQKALFEQVGAVRIPPNKLALVNRFKRALMQNDGDYDRTIAMDEFAPFGLWMSWVPTETRTKTWKRMNAVSSSRKPCPPCRSAKKKSFACSTDLIRLKIRRSRISVKI